MSVGISDDLRGHDLSVANLTSGNGVRLDDHGKVDSFEMPGPGKAANFVTIDGIPKPANAPFTQIGRNPKVAVDKETGITTITYDDLRGGGKPHTLSFHDPMLDKDGKALRDENGGVVHHPMWEMSVQLADPEHHVGKMRVDFDGKGDPGAGKGNVDFMLMQKDSAFPITGHEGPAPHKDWSKSESYKSPGVGIA